MTNGDWIRSMSDEELRDLFGKSKTMFSCPVDKDDEECLQMESCIDCFFKWLKQEVKVITIKEGKRTMGNWISVQEKLPEKHVTVIVARPHDDGPLKVEQGMLTENGWWKVYGTNVKKVYYWMPLPEPPER